MAKKPKKAAVRFQSKTETGKIIGVKKTKILVVGIGGGGGNIVSELAQRLKKATFLAANTDLQALKEVSKKVKPFLFGQNFTQGLGTGMNPELAQLSCEKEKERIKKILQDQDLVIFISCLGGGTGAGATPVFAKICQSLRSLSYGIFTLPFKFEGEMKMEIAKMALEKLRPKLNAITVIPNERIFQIIEKTTPLKTALSLINKNLAEALEGLIETIYQPGLINIDFADLKTILSGWRGKLAYLNTISLAKKEGSAREVVEKAIVSPLYPYGIKGAKGVLYNIAGQRELNLEEVSQISKIISEKAHPEAKIIFGISSASKDKKIIKTTIFATGISAKIFDEKERKKRKIKLKHKKLVSQAPEKSKIKKTEKEKKEIEVSQQKDKEKKEKEIQPEISIQDVKVRKNALQLKKEVEQEEKEILEKEKFWETPAFLRKKLKVN